MNLFKSLSKSIFLLCFFCAFLVFESCDVGLGESVDTIPPTISITYPPTSSVIRDAFVVSGTWVDDKGVSLVKLTLKNEETGETVASRFAGIGIGTWNTSFNVASKDESGKLIYPIPDGKYTISVTAMDLSGRISATSYRSIEIDNTAPVFVITSPGISVYEVLGFSDENQVINQGTATPYGSIFKVNGSIAEAHTVKKITVDVIRKKDNKKITWTESNVNTAGGTSVTLASYGSSNEELNKNYSEVYDDKIAGNQEYYCSITLEDSAVVYQGGAENTGNTTSELWLNDSIYGIDAGDNDLLSKNAAHQYEISDLQKMINGTYSRSADVDAAMAILSKTKVDTTKNNLKFTLNKDANPTYSFLGYSFDSTPGQNKAAQGSKITFKVEAGKNGTQFKPSTFKVYLLGPYSEGSVPADLYGKLKDNSENVIKELEAVDEGQDEDKKLLHKIYDGSDETYGYKGSSLSSWTESIAMPEGVVKADYEYLLFATGMDQDGVFLINDGNKFGFKGTVTGEKPIVYINTEIKDDGYSTLEFLKNFKARIESTETNISDVYLGITVKDLRNNSNVVAELKNIVIEKNVYTKKYYLNSAGDVADADKNIDLVQHIKNIKDTLINDEKTAYETFITKAFEDISGKLYNYTVEIKGESPSGTGKEVFTAKLDTEDPDVNKITITPSIADSEDAAKKYLNGVVTVTAKTTKNEIHAVKVTLFTGSEPAEGAPAYEGTSSDISAKFDTTKLTDNQPLKIRFEITDKAGNSQTIDKALFGDGSIKYVINQKTDEPTIKLSGVDANLTDSSAITVGKNLFGMGNNTLYGTISDDDGLESVTIFVDGVQKKKYTSELHGDTVYSLNEDVSGWGAGDHELKIVVEDKSTKLDASGNEIANHQTVTLDGMAFAYDNDLPTINVSTVNSKSYSSGMWLGKNFTVIGTASDSSGVASVEMNLTTAAPAPDTVLSDTAEAPALKFSSWKDVVSNHVDGKSVNRVYTVKDKYGRTNEVSIIYNIDTQAPVFNPAYINIQGTRASSTDAISLADAQKEGTWFINGNIKIDGWANASGAALIEANADSISVDVNNSVINPQLVEGSADKNTFSATIPLADGTTTINLSTSDKAGNGPAAQPITLKVDTTAPVVTGSLVLSTSKGIFTSGETLLEDSLTVKVKATDATSGIKSAEIQGADASSTSPDADGYYVLTLNKSDLSDGSNDLTVVITDNAGNKNTDKRFTVVVDKVKPVIASSINVLPTVTENLTAYVNGVITVSGRVTDETKLKNADGLRWWVTGTPVASGNTSSGTLTAIASSSYSNKCSLSDGASSDFSIKIDTATLKDGVYTVHLIATDFAGNDSVESTVNFKAKQSTNIPTVVLSGVTQTFVETESEKVTAGKNLFGMGNNTLYGTVKDDNGLSSIKIYVDGVDEEHLKKIIDSSVLNGTTVYSLNEDVTGWGSGTHKLYIVVEDTSVKLDPDGVTEIPAPVKTGTDNSAANVYGMSFAYDNDLPVINISKVNEKSYTSGMWLPTAFNVVGAASDASGVDSVTLKSQTAGTAPATSITGSELAFSSWQDAVSGHIDANNVERIYLVKDKYGRTSEVSIKYSVDTVDPAFDSSDNYSKITVQGVKAAVTTTVAYKDLASTWFTNKTIKIAGANGALIEANLASLTLTADETDYPINANTSDGNSFTTTVSLANDGKAQVVKFSAKDEANNTSAADGLNVSLNIDTTIPVVDSISATVSDVVVDTENIISLTGASVDKFKVTVKATDATSGIAGVSIYEGSTKLVEDTTVKAAAVQGTYEFTVPKEKLTTGNHTLTVYVTDVAGNVNNSKTLTVSVDVDAPDFDGAVNVTPTVTEESNKYVNGVITVSGKLTDETALLAENGLEWWVTGTPVVSGNTSSGALTEIASELAAKKLNLETGRSCDFTFKIDTATLKDGEYTVHLKASDAANNTKVSSVSFTAKQSTNIPTVVLSGVTQTFVETESEKVTAGKNLFGMGNNTLYGTVKDDNGLSSIKIYVDGVDEEHLKKIIDSSVLNGTTVYSLNEDVTGWGSGTHKLYIVVEDTSVKLDPDGVTEIPAPVKTGTDNSAANVYGMSFAYDNDLPVINISKVNEKSYTSGMWLPTAFNVVGAASDASGVDSVTLKSQTAGTAPATSITGSELAFSSWQDAVSGHIDANNVERIYLVTDKYGRTSEVSIKYSVDTVDPVLNTGFMQIEGQRKIAATADQTISGTAETGNGPFTNAVKTGSDIWFTNGSITIAGFVKTTGSLSEQGAALVEKNPDSITVVLNGDTTNPLSINPEVKDSGKGYEAFSTTLSFPEGISVPVQLSVKDMAGNGPVTKTINLKVDTKAPVVEIENPIAANTYTKDDTLSITPTVTDETSGIANIYVGTSSNVSSTNNIGSGTTSGTAISCDISSLIDGIYTIYVIAVDNAGNVSNPVSAGSITVDRTNPVVTVNAPLSESNIYKTYTLSGTVSESNLDTSKAPVLYIWGKLSAESENSWKKATDLYPSCVGITADDAFVNANGAWSINLDTTKINAASGSTTKVYAAIGLTDKAGNTSVPAAAPVTSGDNKSYSLIVNQDYDRPVVSVSSVNSSNSSISTKTIRGTVTDNNGQIQNFWIIESDKYDAVKSFRGGVPETTGDNAWTEVPVQSSGAWSHSFESDGEYKLLFCVKDKSGSIFHTKQTSALSRPRIALGATDASDAVDNDAALVFSIDSTSPEITMLISNEELPADDSKSKSKWGAAGIVYGGTKNSLYIKLEVVEDHPARTGDGTAGSPYVYKLPSVKIAGTSVNDSDIALRDGTSVTGAGTSENPYVFLLKPIELAESAYREKQGSQSVMAFLADSANMEGQGGTSIILDYSLPEVSIITPTPQISDAVSSAISVKGLVTDSYSDIAKLEYVIPEKTHKDDYTVDSTNWAVVNTTSSSWEIEYSSGSTESTQSLCYYGANYDKYEGAAEVSSGLGIYKIPLWFRVTDGVGNKGIVTGKKNDKGVVEPYYVYVDPNGGKPKAWINAPETGSVTSGIVSIYGGASDNVSVSRVCVQIDADDDGDFDEADFNALTKLPYPTPVQANASTFAAGDLVASSAADANDWYIVAEGTNSWKTTYDSSKLAAYSGSTTALRINGKTYLSVRVRAIDNDGETRRYSEPNVITIDNTAPWFTDVKLCQYGIDFDGTVTDGSTTDPIVLGSSKQALLSEREYVSGMYISDVTRTTSGAWYLIATINSNSGIKSVTAQAEISQTQNVIDIAKDGVTTFLSANVTDGVWVEGESKHIERTSTGTKEDDFKTFTLKIPLDTTQSGVIYATISAKNGVGTGTQTVKINIDSTVPALYNVSGAETYNATKDANLRLKSQQKVIGKNSSGSQSYATIENSDGYFTFGDRVNENGSGLQAVAFYFENDIQNMVYDPMVNNSGTTIGSKTNGNLYINEDNLAALYIHPEFVTRSAESSFESDVVENNVHIRKGGLVKIGGVYHTILDVTGKVVTFSPSVSKSFTEVEVIYAQVVDHMLAENLDVDEDDNEIIQNDDGDLMCEVINQIGSTYEWNASIDSNHIPDGSTYIRIVAIDNAGNLSHGKVLSMVANNRPRITKVFIGTDLNGNSKYDFDAEEAPVVSTSKKLRTADGTSFGEFNYYGAYDTRSGFGRSTVTIASNKFKVTNGLCVIPEFTGGNGSLKYVLTDGENSEPQTAPSPVAMTTRDSLNIKTVTGGISMFGNTEIGENGNENPVAYGITDNSDPGNPVTYGDFGGIVIDNVTGNDGAVKTLSFTFWDETDGKQNACGSQWAILNVPVTIKSGDSVPPVPRIKPFHWLSATDNSILIEEKIAKGHIELEDDLAGGKWSEIQDVFGDTEALKKPKVSGKIKLEGTVYDDVRLSSIKLAVFGGESTVVSNYTNGAWVPASLPDGVVSFTAEDLDMSQNGHTVKYTAVIDTEKTSVDIGKTIVVNADDWKGNTVAASGSSQTKRSYALWSAKKSETNAMKTYFTDPACTVAVTEKTNDSDIVYKNEFTDCYIMDVVPYVTEIVTPLSPFYRQAPSVYARTALGSYPVKEGSSVEFRGFNLGTNAAKVTISGMTAKTSLSGGNKITIEETSSGKTGATSGAVSVYVDDIPAINNLNNNNAQGNANKILTSSNYEDYAYNRQPNGINNNMLTDDLAIDVWQFKDAARPVNGGAELVTMKINPKTGIPGFSYANSVLYFNMPAYNGDNGENSWGADNATVSGSQYSQIPVGMNYGGFSHNSFCFDDYGYSYGAAMCTDTQDKDSSAYLQFFSRETPIPYDKYGQDMNYGNCANASRIDMSTMDLSGNGSNYQTNINRIQSISMDTSYSGGANAPSTTTPVYVYMSYFDDITKQVRFRWGTVGDASDNIDGKYNSKNTDNQFTRVGNSYGLDDVINSKYTGYAQDGKSTGTCRENAKTDTDSYIRYSYENNSGVPVQVIAQSTVQSTGTVRGAYKQSTTYKAGKYVAMGIVDKKTTSPKAVVFWSDGLKLYMAYNENPTTTKVWTSKIVDNNGGLNVKCAVDSDGGIHVAYYTTNGGNLKYAYLSSYTATPSICVVDANGAVGTKCTIDVVKNDSGKQVPYISYQLIGGVATYNAKVAYRTDFTQDNFAGADEKDFYTGKWEISVVPTSSLLKDDTINIGLWRDSDGKAKAFTSNKNWKSADILKYGGTAGSSSFETVKNSTMDVGSPSIVYGNNTANPIVGYGVESGAIEIAQKK